MNIYALKSKKKNCWMEFSVESNSPGDFCSDCAFKLHSWLPGTSNLWLNTSEQVCKKIVESGSTEWFNSSYDSPTWDVNYYGELEYVCIAKDVDLPS